MDNKKKVEAVLFSLGKEISLEQLSGLCALSKEETGKILEELKADYEQRDHSLRLIQRGDIWKLTVKDEFLPLVNNLVEGTDLDKSLMETLAVIAWKYPVTQSEVIKLRHNKAYDHIKRLMELEFVEKEKSGRTYKLKLTKKFFEYFDLPSEEAKKAFLRQVPEKVMKEAEAVEKAADEIGQLLEEKKKEKIAREEIKEALEQAKKVNGEKKREEENAKTTAKKRKHKGKVEDKESGELPVEMEGALDEDGEPIEEEPEGEEAEEAEEKIRQGMSWVFR